MYQSRYAMAKFGLESKDIKTSKDKGCEFYMKYFFIYASLIQFLIIVALVLFMVYDNSSQIAKKRQENLETHNHDLIFQVKNLSSQNEVMTQSLNKSLTEQNKQLAALSGTKNILDQINKTLNSCNAETVRLNQQINILAKAFDATKDCSAKMQIQKHQCDMEKMMLNNQKTNIIQEYDVYKANCTKSNAELSKKLQSSETEKESCRLVQIDLNREKDALKEQTQQCQGRCNSVFEEFNKKTDHVVSTFDRAIQGTFPIIPMLGSSEEVRKQIEQIKANCTPLSYTVRQQFEEILRQMKSEINNIVRDNSQLRSERDNWQMKLRDCDKNRTSMVDEMNRKIRNVALAKDAELQKELMEKMQLRKEKDELSRKIEEKGQQLSYIGTTLQALNSSLVQCNKAKVDFTVQNSPTKQDAWLKGILNMANQLQDVQKVPGK